MMSLFAMSLWMEFLDAVRFVNRLFSEDIVILAPVSNIIFVVGKLEE